MKRQRPLIQLLLASSAIALTACSAQVSDNSGGGGGGGGSSVQFSFPSSVDVLKVDTASQSSISSLAYSDAGTDYSNQPQHFRVNHPVGEALSTTSEITCFIGQLAIDQMWDETKLPRVYLVGVDEKKCNSSSGQPSQGASTGGDGGSSAAAQLTMVTVRLSREATGGYPRAEIWFNEADGPGGQPMEIRASIDVTTEPSDAKPYGGFDLAFGMYMSGVMGGGGQLISSASASSAIAFTFYESFSEQGQSAVKGASVAMDADGSNLKAAIESSNPWEGNSAWVVASNATNIKANSKTSGNAAAGSVSEVDLNGGKCLNKASFKYRVHGYGLYTEADGEKVTLNTGVSCQYTDSSSASRHCHIGRYGAWFDRESDGTEHTFANGDTVTQQAWGSDAANNGRTLTLFVSEGKLMKYEVKSYTLSEIEGMDIRYWDNSSNAEFIVQYRTDLNNNTAGFYKIATMSWSNNGPPSKTELTTDASTRLLSFSNGEWVWFWSDAMGGMTYIGGASNITARAETMIGIGHSDFGGGNLQLKCLGRCLKYVSGGLTSTDFGSWNGAYETDPTTKSEAFDYIVDGSNLALYKGTSVGTNQITVSSSSAYDNTMYSWGVESGAMITSTAYGDLTDLWDIYNQQGATYYQYRMGPNNWDKTILVSADGGTTYLSFDEPIGFDYTHATANDRNGDSKYNGKKFYLRYHGEGHMEGFPWVDVDRDGDGQSDMWFPEISLNDDIQLVNNSVNYRIKAMYGDLTLPAVADEQCASLSLALPDSAVPTSASRTPSNNSTSKPDHAGCQYDSVSETASAECS